MLAESIKKRLVYRAILCVMQGGIAEITAGSRRKAIGNDKGERLAVSELKERNTEKRNME